MSTLHLAKKNVMKNPGEVAFDAIMAIIEPTLQALKEVTVPSRRSDNPSGPDTGHTPRVEGSLKYVFQGFGNTLQHQLAGNMGSFTNAQGQLTRTLATISELQRKYQGDEDGLLVDQNFLNSIQWLKVNEARVDALTTLLAVVKAVYKEITNLDFKAQEIITRSPVNLSGEERDALKAQLAEINCRMAQRPQATA